MAKTFLGTVLHYVRGRAAAEQARGVTDHDLLGRFVSTRDADAFAALVDRHAARVLGVCRRVLGGEQDAEDAFQATFLVLARQARSLRNGEALASWLHGVAYRTAVSAKRAAARRRLHERQAPTRSPADPARELAWREVQAVLEGEVARLAPAYRAPFVLCIFEGKSEKEAARQLGLKEGTVSSRLARARGRLRRRLAQRGIELGTVLGAAVVAREVGAAAPAALKDVTVQAAVQAAGGQSVGGLVTSAVAALVEGGGKSVAAARRKVLLAVLLLSGACAVGVAVLAYQGDGDRPVQAAGRSEGNGVGAEKEERPGRRDVFGDPLPRHALLQLGTQRFHHEGDVTGLAFSPDRKRLVSAGPWESVVWELPGGKARRRLPAHGAVTFSPDGKLLAAASGARLVVLQMPRGKTLWDANGPGGTIGQVVFSRDGKAVAVSTADGLLRVWDASGRPLCRAEGSRGPDNPVALSPDGKLLAANGPGHQVLLRDAAAGTILRKLAPGAGDAQALAFTPDGKKVFTLCRARRKDAGPLLCSWEARTGKQLTRWETVFLGPPFVFSPDCRFLAANDASPSATLALLDLAAEGAATNHLTRALGGPTQVAFTADGELLAAGSSSGTLFFVSLRGEGPPAYLGHVGAPRAIAFSRDGKRLATGDAVCLRLWDGTTGQEVESHALGFGWGGVDSVAFSPSGKYLAAASFTATVQLRNADTGLLLKTFEYPDESPVARFLPGDVLLLKTRKVIEFYDPARRKMLHTLRPREAIFHFDVSPDGKLLAVVPYRTLHRRDVPRPGRIDLYDVPSGKKLRSLAGFSGSVELLAFFPDGQAPFLSGLAGCRDARACRRGATPGRQAKGGRAPCPRVPGAVRGRADVRPL
jgi:RNA polymerase sigma factor (sigma-70 family)